MGSEMSLKASTSLALTVDVEGEWFGLPGEQGSFELQRIVDAVRNLELLLDRIESGIGARIPVTWFIRCDDSVEAVTGEVSGLLQSLESFILRRSALGDVFGVHPHLYRLQQGQWVSETESDRQIEQVERAVRAWESYFGSLPVVSRMGEAVMNNILANAINELGIACDSSALAGRKRFDSGFQFDWTGTPPTPYHPSTRDYRRPAENGEAAYRFLEVPFTMLPITAPFDENPINRYCNLAFWPELIKSALQRMATPDKVIAVVHPHELLTSIQQHPLISHSSASLETNILNLTAVFGELKFVLLSERCDADMRL